MKIMLTRPYKGKNGKWVDAGSTISMTAAEAKRVAGIGGCVEVVTPDRPKTGKPDGDPGGDQTGKPDETSGE